MLSTISDPSLRVAAVAGAAALALTLAIGILILGLRLQARRDVRRWQGFVARWRPLLLGAMLSPESAPLPALARLDHGRFLLVPGEDCYGDTVNVACKLGEDLARPGEVLLTAAAKAQLGDCPYPLREQVASITGLELRTYSVEIPRA